jgi:hypothetical protein
VAERDIDEGKLATAIEDSLSDVRFDKLNFAWHMVNKSPRTQGEFWEMIYVFIQEMGDYYRRGMVDSKNLAVAQMCNEINRYLEGDYNRDPLELDLSM